MANTVSAEQLDEKNPLIHVQGVINYNRLISRIDGEELARTIKNDKSMYPQTKPHLILDLNNASVIPISGDPNQLTINETFVSERRFESKKPEQGMRYRITPTAINDSMLPTIWKRASNEANENGQYTYTQLLSKNMVEALADKDGVEANLTGDLPAGTPVRVVLRVYLPKGSPKRGIAIHSVYVEDDHVDTGMGGVDRDALAKAGILLDRDPVAPVAVNNTNSENSALASESAQNTGLPMPATPPVATQPSHPNQNNYVAQQAPQQAPQQQTPQPQYYNPNAAPQHVPANQTQSAFGNTNTGINFEQ